MPNRCPSWTDADPSLRELGCLEMSFRIRDMKSSLASRRLPKPALHDEATHAPTTVYFDSCRGLSSRRISQSNKIGLAGTFEVLVLELAATGRQEHRKSTVFTCEYARTLSLNFSEQYYIESRGIQVFQRSVRESQYLWTRYLLHEDLNVLSYLPFW